MLIHKRTIVISAISILVAIASTLLLAWLIEGQSYSQVEINSLWESGVLPTFAILSLVFGLVEPKAPWRWPLLLMYVNYVSRLWIMKDVGQLLPFELVFITVYALPMILLAYGGVIIRRKFVRN